MSATRARKGQRWQLHGSSVGYRGARVGSIPADLFCGLCTGRSRIDSPFDSGRRPFWQWYQLGNSLIVGIHEVRSDATAFFVYGPSRRLGCTLSPDSLKRNTSYRGQHPRCGHFVKTSLKERLGPLILCLN